MYQHLIVSVLWMCCGVAVVFGQDPAEVQPSDAKEVKSAAPAAYTEAVGQAAKERKYLFVLFVQDDCQECDCFQERVLDDPRYADWWQWYAVVVKLNMSDPAVGALARSMNVQTIPTMVLMTNKAKELGRAVGADGCNRFRAHLRTAVYGDHIVSGVVFGPWDGEDVVGGAMERGDRLFLSGKLEEANRVYSWCLDHRVARSASFTGQHLEELCECFVRLGKYHQPALDKLKQVIAKAERDTLTGRAMAAFELNVIKHGYGALGQEDRIIAFHDRLKEVLPGSPQSEVFAKINYESLLNARRYEDLRYSVEDPDELNQFLVQVGRGQHPKDEVRKLLSCRYEVLLGLGEDDRAAEVARELVRYDESAASYMALAEAGYRTGREHREVTSYARSANMMYRGKNPKAVMLLARVLASHSTTRDEAISLLRNTIKMTDSQRVKEELDACLGELLTDPEAGSRRPAADRKGIPEGE